MIRFIEDFLSKRRESKRQSKIAQLQKKAMELQRNGNLREYAVVMKEIETLEEQYND
tara:strand:- start:625 stop:795 length:171 start_codon:yes stop_codon:yes gene_type:complete